METISGTTASLPRGWAWIPGGDTIAVEPGGDFDVTVTVAPGGAVEWRDLDTTGQPTGSWNRLDVGASITRGKGQRVALRPLAGTAAVTFAWSGPGLAELAKYTGAQGTTVSWG